MRDPEGFNLVVKDCSIGAIQTRLSDKQVVMMWEFWRDELANPESDEQFRDWMVYMGRAEPCESGRNLELRLS